MVIFNYLHHYDVIFSFMDLSKRFNRIPGERHTVGTGRIQCISGAFHWKAPETRQKMEAVFQPELSRIFSDDFRPFPIGKHRKFAEIHRKKIRKTSGRNTASISDAFPRDMVTFPHLSCRIPQDTVAGIFDMG
jgi:hypothetical protein